MSRHMFAPSVIRAANAYEAANAAKLYLERLENADIDDVKNAAVEEVYAQESADFDYFYERTPLEARTSFMSELDLYMTQRRRERRERTMRHAAAKLAIAAKLDRCAIFDGALS
ncbi:MAG: hypothetical protein ACEQSB_00165 [Undibacterium sp.]